ncbi:hypothetical protein ACNUDN_22840 [Mycobacterium sp. smrl_JER01]|uniref:hypothetical protein n=1 Tax=Mycobacterium sp. smrl_JER01 TaxID=3402633 RepID=UPI003AC00BB8
MSANPARPARHRVVRESANGSAPTFWAARLLDGGTPVGSPRHARGGGSRYAQNVGRVGALAVSLGIGLAVANSATGVAVADDSDSGSSVSTAGSNAGPAADSTPSGNDPQGADSGSDDAGQDDGDDDGALDDDDLGEDLNDDDLGEDLDDEDLDDGDGTGEAGAGQGADDQDGDDGSAEGDVAAPDANAGAQSGSLADDSEISESVDQGTQPGDGGEPAGIEEVRDPTDDLDAEGAVPDATVDAVVPSPSGGTDVEGETSVVALATDETVSEVNLFSAVMSTVISPLLAPEVPVPASITDALLAWFRRIITHTFFNKTPVVRSVTTTQIITGQVIIDIDAYDPNGDPLTYDIIQPAGGFVFRDLLTGKFVYTPLTPVIGDPRPVEFTVIVRDDSENLTGVLGSIQRLLHSVARAFGLAEAENFTQGVSFNADPILQLPPSMVAVGGLPYTLGGDPVKVLSLAEIIDLDSSSMDSVTVTIGLGYQSGDKLGYVAPDGVDLDVEWVNDYTLTLSGTRPIAQYEAALKAVTFSATQLGLLGRTVEITLVDEQGLGSLLPATALVAVLPAIYLPPSLVAAGGLPYVLAGNPVKLLSIAEIIDLDSSSMQSVTLTITGGRQTGDTLGYIAPDGSLVTGTWENDWTLTLTGPASTGQFEAALKAVTFSATELGLLARTVEITPTDTDGVQSLLPTLVAIGVLPSIVIELPLTVTPIGLPVHTIGKPPVPLMSGVSIANADDGMLSGATVTIGLGRMSGDKLTYTAPAGNPVVVVQTNDWTLTLSGAATVAQYQEALKAISFSATQLGLTRTVSITVVEADGDTNPIPGVVFANTAAPLLPTVAVLSLPPTYTLGKPGVVLAPVVEIVDLDSTTMTGATVKITGGRQSGDVLNYTPPAGSSITATWNGTDTLTLSGVATKAQYEAALEAVTFAASGGVAIIRTFSINVTDDSGVNAALPALVLGGVKNPDRPTLAVLGLSGLAFPSVGQTVRPITSATIIDPDSTVLTGATVKITDNFVTGDTLTYTPIAGNPVTASFNSATRELTLSGTATLAQYKQALEAVTFKATQYGGGWLSVSHTRTLSIYVTDDSNVSNLLPGIVLVTVYR